LATPAVSARDKKALMERVFTGKVCDELLNFLRVLIDKGRSRHLAKILRVYKDLLRKEEGFSYGEILSVTPLGEARLQKLEEKVGKLLSLNVKLENKLEAGLIGGVKVYVDGKIIDASVKGRLKEMRGGIKQ
jgi:ATP synthase F1 delta subunit